MTVTFDSVNLTVKTIGFSGTAQDSIQITLRKTTSGTSGGTDLLMVVRNTGGLTTEETNIKSLIESWGYTVSTIDEDDTQANFDAAFASNDVVYISEEVSADDVKAKVRDASIGVVNEEINLVGDFGIADDFAFPTWTTNVNITNNSHYITSTFSTGLLSIFTTTQPVTNISNNSSDQASGLQILGEFGSTEPSLIVLEQDSTLYLDLLMVVEDADDPSTQAELRKTQVESWGYDNKFIDDGDSQSEFDERAAVSVVTYVLEEIDSGTHGKLKDFTIGVVTEEDNGDDAMGFSSSDGADITGTAIDITDNSHYITSPYSTGSLTVLTSSDDLAYQSGTAASGLQVLAEQVSSSNDVLFIMETGAALYSSGTAAGRRVRMPWHNIDFTRLNSNGLTLLQRSLQWASTPTSKVKGRRVELPWGGNDYDVNTLTSNGQTLMKRSIEWAAGATTGTTSATYTIATWKEL